MLVLLAVALFAYQRSRTAIDLIDAASAPPAPHLVVRDANGTSRTLSERVGEVVVVNLWADWCGPCRREVPRLSRLHEDLAAEGLELWGVNADALGGARLSESARSLRIDYPVFEPVSGIQDFAGGEVLPFTWLIDREGRVRAAHGGLPSESSLRRAVKELLAEPTSR